MNNQNNKYADAPNSPHKKWIFGRLNRYYVEPERASSIVDNHMTPLLDEYTDQSTKAAQAAAEGDYGKFNDHIKQAMAAYTDYKKLLDMLVNSEKYSPDVNHWKQQYAWTISQMNLTEEQREDRENTERPRIDLDHYMFRWNSEQDKAAVLEDVSLIAEELSKSTDYAEGNTDSREQTANYVAVMSMAYEKNYNAEDNFLTQRKLALRKQRVYSQLEESERAEQAEKLNRQAREDNQRAWDQYESQHHVIHNDYDDKDNEPDVDPDYPSEDDHDFSDGFAPVEHHYGDHPSEEDDHDGYDPRDKNKDGDPYNDHDGDKNYQVEDDEYVVYTKKGKNLHREVVKRSLSDTQGESPKEAPRDSTPSGYGTFGKKVYENWNKIPVVGKAFSPTSMMRKRFWLGPVPITISSGIAGMRHPLDVISNVSVGAGGASYSIYSRDKERGFTYVNLPGGIDLRGKRKKKTPDNQGDPSGLIGGIFKFLRRG